MARGVNVHKHPKTIKSRESQWSNENPTNTENKYVDMPDALCDRPWAVPIGRNISNKVQHETRCFFTRSRWNGKHYGEKCFRKEGQCLPHYPHLEMQTRHDRDVLQSAVTKESKQRGCSFAMLLPNASNVLLGHSTLSSSLWWSRTYDYRKWKIHVTCTREGAFGRVFVARPLFW